MKRDTVPLSGLLAVPLSVPINGQADRATLHDTARGTMADLLARPQRYALFQAVRLLLRWLGRQGIAPEHALNLLRFRNSLALSFPASEIEAISLSTGPVPAVHLTSPVMGLLGVTGSLPLHYTERIAAWQAATRDDAPRAFFDLFSSRQVALFYRAWCKYRVRHPAHGESDRFLPLLLALAGERAGEEDADAASRARFAAALRSRVVNAELIAGVLRSHFGVPVVVEQFTGRWDILAFEQRTLLAHSNCELGFGATAGARLARPELGMRVRLGPLARQDFVRFLPGAAGARALADLLDRFAIDVPYRELQVVLRREDVAATRLDGATRLGLDGFLSAGAVEGAGGRDRDDVCYLLP